jgi:Uma2 family endonuclease
MYATLSPVSLRLTPQEYFEWEETQEEKHDYIHGEVFAMSGGSRSHNRITLNLAAVLMNLLSEERCEVFASDMRVEVDENGRYVYPDVAVVCEAPAFLDVAQTTLLNPTLIVEVLSRSTEAYDRGDKLGAYREVDSVQEIVLVHQDQRKAERFRRRPGGQWLLEDVTDGVLSLDSVGAEVPLDDLYAGTGL